MPPEERDVDAESAPDAPSFEASAERLQVIVAHQRSGRTGPDWLPKLQQELLDVVRRYVNIDEDAVQVETEHDDDLEMLRLNITLPDTK